VPGPETLSRGVRAGLILSLVVPEGAGRGTAPEVLLWLRPLGSRWVAENPAPSEEGRPMADGAKSGEDVQEESKRWLVKAARMYAMCQKAEVAEPMDVTGLALAAFEEMTLKQALVFVRSNEQNIEDLAWAFKSSNSPEEFEQRVKELKNLPERAGQQPAEEEPQ
jgi:hypothetical protein